MHLSAQSTADDLIHHAGVAVAAIKIVAELAGEQQTAHKVAQRDLAAAQL